MLDERRDVPVCPETARVPNTTVWSRDTGVKSDAADVNPGGCTLCSQVVQRSRRKSRAPTIKGKEYILTPKLCALSHDTTLNISVRRRSGKFNVDSKRMWTIHTQASYTMKTTNFHGIIRVLLEKLHKGSSTPAKKMRILSDPS